MKELLQLVVDLQKKAEDALWLLVAAGVVAV